jgi:16S rRNA processing protein RimM
VSEPTAIVGIATKPHGLDGEVVVQNLSDNADRWVPGASVLSADGRPLTVKTVRTDRARLLVRFEEITDRLGAESVRGELAVPRASLPELSEGDYWPHELLGCQMVSESGRELGSLTKIVPGPANDLWVASGADGTETMIPAVRDLIESVDVTGKRIVVRDLPGLTVPEE